MATDIKKFLDQQGVGTLWNRIVTKVNESVAAEAKLARDAEAANAKAISDLDAKVGDLPEGTTAATVIEYVDKKTEGIASDAALTSLTGRVTAIENDHLTAVDKQALEKSISDEVDRADKAEKANAAAIKAISDDYLKGADKTELSNAIALKADTSALDQEVSNRETAVSELQTQINTIMNNPDAEGAINSINEFTKYVEEHGTLADGFRTDIDKNKDDIAAMDAAYKAADAALKTELEAEITKKADIITVNGVDGRLTEMEEAVAEHMLYTNGKIANLETADTELDSRIDALEAKFGEGEGSVADQIADAKQAAIDAAAADATSKANAAETNAKAHADSLNTAMNTRVEALEAIDHDHSNKTVLDGITADKVTAWDAALQAADITTGTANGTISVKGTDVVVKGLGSAAYVDIKALTPAEIDQAIASAAV